MPHSLKRQLGAEDEAAVAAHDQRGEDGRGQQELRHRVLLERQDRARSAERVHRGAGTGKRAAGAHLVGSDRALAVLAGVALAVDAGAFPLHRVGLGTAGVVPLRHKAAEELQYRC